jgi:hypothetical protein
VAAVPGGHFRRQGENFRQQLADLAMGETETAMQSNTSILN